MNNPDATQLLLDIINKAKNGQAHPFRPILYWNEFRYYKRWTSSTFLIIKTLKASARSLLSEYCQDVIAGISDVMMLLAYRQLLDIIAFYEKELDTVKRMLDDYDSYLGKGHFWYSFLGGRREL